jgi:RHS repeat-associated protein
VVIVQRESASTTTEATYLLFKDHLGSVFTTLATTGEIISQQLFSAFGQTRTIYTAGGVALGSMLPPTEQGFTGHRQMDALGIVHMKGRIYDPTLGRFLQADPFVQEPKNSQNYNRYSYVLNNPMSYTDPSGYFFKAIFERIKKYWRVIAAAVVSYFTFGAASGWASSWALSSGVSASAAGFAGAIVGGAAAGFASGAIMTGSLRGAMSGALAGAITGGIFEGIAQYGFNTSTVKEAAGAMLLEEAGVPRETIMKLYGKLTNTSSLKTPNRFNGDKEGLEKALSSLNKRIESLKPFEFEADAAKWLHENGLPISDKYQAETYANIYNDAKGGYSIGKVITSYDSRRVIDLYRSTPFSVNHGRTAFWHTHPAGDSGFSVSDFDVLKRGSGYVSYSPTPGYTGEGLKIFNATKAWKELGSQYGLMPQSIGDAHTNCVFQNCAL